jgi:hypothetical protein
MNHLLIISLCLLLLQLPVVEQPVGGIQLLKGYTYKNHSGVDTRVATISKAGGMVIDIEYGLAGAWVNQNDFDKYVWHKEQIINGHKVTMALIKPGLKTVWEADSPRNKEPGNILLITIPLNNVNNDPDYVIDFKAEITSSEEMVDMILMVLTFDPAKLKFCFLNDDLENKICAFN